MFRRLIASTIKRQNLAIRSNNVKKSTRSEKISSPEKIKFPLFNSIRRSVLPRILGYYFGKFYRDTRHGLKNNFLLVSPTTISTELIEYKPTITTTTMRPTINDESADCRRGRSRSPEEREIVGLPNTESPDIESSDNNGSLDELQIAYSNAQQNKSNIWLDYAQKSCYIYLYQGGGKPSESLAAFDLDGTLIKPKSNKRIPKSATDWDLFSVWTKVKLQQILRDNNARFVIFTNQYGIGMNIVPLEEVQQRIELVLNRLDIPCTVFMATEKDEFRKPRTGMFQLFNKSFNDSLSINYEKSFYCGDAVGYPSHSDADIKFAQKLGLPFLPPEKFIRGVKPKLVS